MIYPRTPRGFITSEEGRRNVCYRDNRPAAYPTIGIGHKDERMIPGVTTWTDEQVDATFESDYAKAAAGITASFPAFRSLDLVRQAVLVSMAFQMGVAGVLGFHHALAAIAAHRWAEAAQAMASSDWRVQTPERNKRACDMMLTGLWPDKFNGEV